MTWIWLNDEEKNSFAEFELPFDYSGGTVELRISADYKYAAYIGDALVSFGQYADLPYFKCLNSADITPYVKAGTNVLRVVAWHMGDDFSVCRTMPASVTFEISVDGEIVGCSDGNTRCRKAVGYRGGDRITSQLGMGFHYDFTAPPSDWQCAGVVDTGFAAADRPIKQTAVGALYVPKIIAQGIFKHRGGTTAAEKMQNAWMASLRFGELTHRDRMENDTLNSPLTFGYTDGDGIFVVADMGKEVCGHLGFSVTVDRPCKMLLGWGEHLSDLRVRTSVGGRNFAIEIDLAAGENVLDDYLLRLGCRYICIFAETDRITVSRLGIREVGYPFKFPDKKFGDRLLDAIYETGRRTLFLSAHEHYEDCPWREQALYGMDSRNQMLFGYSAFEEYDYPRANLMLMARSQQENGLIPLTAPARMPIAIPSFTAYWLIAIGECTEADFDEAFIREILPYAERGMRSLLSRERDSGLSVFTDPAGWNFHEWSSGLDGGEIFRDYEIEEKGDAGLTALASMASGKLSYLHERLGNAAKAEEWNRVKERLAASLECYYDKGRGLYASYLKDGVFCGFHEFTQAVVLCTGGVPKERIPSICEMIKSPKEHGLIPVTLSALQLKYQALIMHGGDIDYCVEDIVRIFGGMILGGATSYFETENGEADFGDAGSLCHGWSAVCCWVLEQYLKHKNK